MITFCRMTKDGKNCLLFHFNFSPVVYEGFRSGVPCPGTYTEVFNNNRREYGGAHMLNEQPISSEPIAWDYQQDSIQYDLPAFGMVAFRFDYVPPKKRAAVEVKPERPICVRLRQRERRKEPERHKI